MSSLCFAPQRKSRSVAMNGCCAPTVLVDTAKLATITTGRHDGMSCWYLGESARAADIVRESAPWPLPAQPDEVARSARVLVPRRKTQKLVRAHSFQP
jgi:hypothetical protein